MGPVVTRPLDPKARSLTEFAAAADEDKPGYVAWLETIPERDEILEAWHNGVSAGVIRRWLIRVRGYDPDVASVPRVNRRLQAHYPREQT